MCRRCDVAKEERRQRPSHDGGGRGAIRGQHPFGGTLEIMSSEKKLTSSLGLLLPHGELLNEVSRAGVRHRPWRLKGNPAIEWNTLRLRVINKERISAVLPAINVISVSSGARKSPGRCQALSTPEPHPLSSEKVQRGNFNWRLVRNSSLWIEMSSTDGESG
jgi:hypothetical protein